jgi:hypothetical protein
VDFSLESGLIPFLKRNQIIIMLLLAVVVSFAILWKGLIMGVLLIALAIGFLFLLICIISRHFAVLSIVTISSFIFIVNRILGQTLPSGILIDGLLLCTLIGIMLKSSRKVGNLKQIINNPVTFVIALYTAYTLLQVFNPEGSHRAWLMGLRGLGSFLVAYYVLSVTFDGMRFVELFTKLWLVICFIAAIYCFYQEFVGLPSYDLKWVTANETRRGLNWIQGRWRKWSFFSDVAAFGMMMAFASIFTFVMATGPFRKQTKLLLIFAGMCMLLAMVYSGTRGAYAMVPIGFVFFALATLNNKRTLAVSILSLSIIVVLIFGPFYSAPINRIRSTFEPSDDPSMIVREENRRAILPYVYDHPMGGGIYTSGTFGVMYAPGHPLAGYPPDSDYFETVLETGWIGLLIHLSLYGAVMLVGIRNYYQSRNRKIRTYYLAYLSAFFALTIAAFVKKAVDQFPLGFIVGAIYVLMPKMSTFDDEK